LSSTRTAAHSQRCGPQVRRTFPGMNLSVFSERDIANPERRAALESALATADVFFGSLLFDYDDVEWLKDRVDAVPLRFVFESALELMSETRVGAFEMAPPADGKKAGPPPVVKKVLGMFGSGREEDRLSGYLSFLKIGPKILKFFPMQKAQDLRAWCGAPASACSAPPAALFLHAFGLSPCMQTSAAAWLPCS